MAVRDGPTAYYREALFRRFIEWLHEEIGTGYQGAVWDRGVAIQAYAANGFFPRTAIDTMADYHMLTVGERVAAIQRAEAIVQAELDRTSSVLTSKPSPPAPVPRLGISRAAEGPVAPSSAGSKQSKPTYFEWLAENKYSDFGDWGAQPPRTAPVQQSPKVTTKAEWARVRTLWLDYAARLDGERRYSFTNRPTYGVTDTMLVWETSLPDVVVEILRGYSEMKKSERASAVERSQHVLRWGAACLSDGESPDEFNERAWTTRSSLASALVELDESSSPRLSPPDSSTSHSGLSVERLRSMPYDDYLRTEHWQRVRAGALTRAEHRCQVCNSPYQLQVHHRTYERRGQERDTDLTVLCDTCHGRFHREGHLYAGSSSSGRSYTPRPYTGGRYSRARGGRREPAYGAFFFGVIAAVVVLLIVASVLHARLEFHWNGDVFHWWF